MAQSPLQLTSRSKSAPTGKPGWLSSAPYARLTNEIIRLERALNARFYALFDLTPAEIKVIEETTKSL